ncbi:hypothetical protein AC578_1628 [Pseudocercospora eumusae]|uniref:Uncharacterized protein n=1 Tax=Pseudocercospora eumusae TaxID=321146 RepID=A0A139HM77_9PEZI|nr:hypothetical protein AC578_1628 [Pseudocercospora eumusae]
MPILLDTVATEVETDLHIAVEYQIGLFCAFRQSPLTTRRRILKTPHHCSSTIMSPSDRADEQVSRKERLLIGCSCHLAGPRTVMDPKLSISRCLEVELLGVVAGLSAKMDDLLITSSFRITVVPDCEKTGLDELVKLHSIIQSAIA